MNSASLPNFSIKISNHKKCQTDYSSICCLANRRYVLWYSGKKNIKQGILEVSAGISLIPIPSVQYSTLYFIYNFIPLLLHTVIYITLQLSEVCHLTVIFALSIPNHHQASPPLLCSQIVYR